MRALNIGSRPCTHTHKHTNTYTHTHKHIHTPHTHTHKHIHTQHTDARARAHTSTRTHTHTHTHTHTQIYTRPSSGSAHIGILRVCVAVCCNRSLVQSFSLHESSTNLEESICVLQCVSINTKTTLSSLISTCGHSVGSAVRGGLQHTATHCNTPQHTATHRNTLQHTATHCNTLQ